MPDEVWLLKFEEKTRLALYDQAGAFHHGGVWRHACELLTSEILTSDGTFNLSATWRHTDLELSRIADFLGWLIPRVPEPGTKNDLRANVEKLYAWLETSAVDRLGKLAHE